MSRGHIPFPAGFTQGLLFFTFSPPWFSTVHFPSASGNNRALVLHSGSLNKCQLAFADRNEVGAASHWTIRLLQHGPELALSWSHLAPVLCWNSHRAHFKLSSLNLLSPLSYHPVLQRLDFGGPEASRNTCSKQGQLTVLPAPILVASV